MKNTPRPPSRVDIELGPRSYAIHIGTGLIKNAGQHLESLITNRHIVIIADEAIAQTYLPPLVEALAKSASKIDDLTVPSGESSKSLARFEQVLENLLSLNIDRKVLLIALGGGVIGDLSGYVAASLFRGVDFIQVPTTLLAQVDSSVGGKTGINAKAGKNLIGAFHQPKAVLADTDTLSTLPIRELKAGYAEIAKYGLLGDAAFFDWLDQEQQNILQLNPTPLTQAIEHCCRAKAAIVAADETESGQRALLNLGHTFGHAYEAEAGYDGSVLHGEAIAAGITDAYRLGVRLGTASIDDLERVKAHFSQADLPTHRAMLSSRLAKVATSRLITHMQKDKKVASGQIVFIVPHGIGDAKVEKSVDIDLVRDVMENQEI